MHFEHVRVTIHSKKFKHNLFKHYSNVKSVLML